MRRHVRIIDRASLGKFSGTNTIGGVIALHEAPETFDPIPLDAIANHTVPKVRCQRCQCWMSTYHAEREAWCWPCQSAAPGMMPARTRIESGTGTSVVVSMLLAAGGSATAREIRAASGLPAPTVKDVLRRLRLAGTVTQTSGHPPTYHLAAVAAA
jgi:hypothetical protein